LLSSKAVLKRRHPYFEESEMEYIKIRFINDFDHAGSKFEKTLEEMFNAMNPMFSFSQSSWKPQLDIYETPEYIFVTAELAGVEKEDVELEISSRSIRIFGRRISTPCAENGRYRLAEIQYGAFERALQLPAPIDTENVNASYKKGMLQVFLKKLLFEKKIKVPISDE
jgi:HSP20 family protein